MGDLYVKMREKGQNCSTLGDHFFPSFALYRLERQWNYVKAALLCMIQLAVADVKLRWWRQSSPEVVAHLQHQERHTPAHLKSCV